MTAERQHAEPDRYLDAEEVAQRLGGGSITAGTVRRRARRWGLIPCHVGKYLRWKASDVAAYIDRHTG